METGLRVFLLSGPRADVPHAAAPRTLALLCCLSLSLSACGLFKRKEPELLGASAPQTEEPLEDASQQPVVEPQVARRSIRVPKITKEDFETSLHAGFMSIEDFGGSPSLSARLAYHISEDFFLEGAFGYAKGGLTSYERLAGGVRLLTDRDRQFTYYAINMGWNALPGEVFVGKNRAYNSAIYLSAGLGGTTFAGDNRFTANIGVGYRVLLTRRLAAHVDFRDYLFDIDVLGSKKVANNLEGSLGISVFF